MPQIGVRTREDIAAFLPDAIETALGSYKAFSSQSVPEDAKDFKAHHDACKVAIAHIQLLIKLAEWADLPDPNIDGEENNKFLQELIEEGQKELGRRT